jgi:exodeoxyribonuclease VIII
MLDLETLGTSPDSVIIAIGAVKFDNDCVYDRFYQVVDPDSCVKAGLKIDADTVMWWMQQDIKAREVFKTKGVPLKTALLQFAEWVEEDEAVWGNGADFDNVLLSTAYRLCNAPTPWKYYNNRCYRTMKNMYPSIKAAHTGVKHNALDDAEAQAVHLIKILAHIRGK